jgi:sulfopyruvate decarboxylase alpha subunit
MNSINGSESANGWPADIYRVFRSAGIRQVGYVPDSGHAELIRLCTSDPDIAAVPLTSEEEGVGLVAGAWLGGQRGAILMQSSGVGNCMNMFTLASNCGFPVLLLVTMRGEWEEFNPWQIPMGRSAGPMIELAGGTVYRAEDAASAGPVVEAAAGLAFNTSGLVAVALAQKLIGAKSFGRATGEK